MYRDGHAGKMYILHLCGILSIPLGLMSQQVKFISQLSALTTKLKCKERKQPNRSIFFNVSIDMLHASKK